jgi:hypothetical protein
MNRPIIASIVFLCAAALAGATITEDSNYNGSMNNGRVDQIIQGNDTCYVLAMDAVGGPRWLLFESYTPKGVALLSELLLAKSKAYTGLGFRWTNPSKGWKPIPSFGGSAISTYQVLDALRL